MGEQPAGRASLPHYMMSSGHVMHQMLSGSMSKDQYGDQYGHEVATYEFTDIERQPLPGNVEVREMQVEVDTLVAENSACQAKIQVIPTQICACLYSERK